MNEPSEGPHYSVPYSTHASEKPERISIIAVVGPTASGKSAEAIRLAKLHDGEIISVDSRQIYRGLNIGTEKMSAEEMQGIPHHLIDIRDPHERYSAGEFAADATQLISDIHARGKKAILAGGTHFYFDALLNGLPNFPMNEELRMQLESVSNEELLQRISEKDPARAAQLDPQNRRRLIRALEIIESNGTVPARELSQAKHTAPYDVTWVVLNPERDTIRERIDARLTQTLERGLLDEVRHVRELVGDERLNEFGLEYKIVGEYLRGERAESSLFSALSSKLWHYARRQKAWLRKLAFTNHAN